ncbi:MAG TPA: hypothetical protein VMU82_09175, partial [Acetobacteraceae bacterium]|nr:hypothetical protein [Acetobacteraceae bacterium]
ETTVALRAWLAVRPHGADPALFLNGAGRTMTRTGFEYILAKHVVTAVSTITLFGGPAITEFDGLPASTSRQL